MKKFLYIILILSIIGIFLSAVLLHQHFYTSSGVAEFFCGSDINSSCKALSQTKYSSLFGIPIAAYGIIFYSIILLILGLAEIARKDYYRIALALLLPIAAASIAADIVLLIILIVIGIFCELCIATYIVNIAIFVLLVLCYKILKNEEDFTIPDIYKKIIGSVKNISHARAGAGAFILTIVFLSFSIFSLSLLLDSKTKNTRLSYNKIKKYINEYQNTLPENVELPVSNLAIGSPDAPIKVIVFTDFLCSFCYRFYQAEEYIAKKYGESVMFEHYSYPLDMNCNNNIKRTVYKNSCIASKAMYAAAAMGLLKEYMEIHFKNYHKIHKSYNRSIAIRLFNQLGSSYNTGEFIKLLDSKDMESMLGNDIETAKGMNIRSTPTIFINNKRIRGYRPKEVIDSIIKNIMD